MQLTMTLWHIHTDTVINENQRVSFYLQATDLHYGCVADIGTHSKGFRFENCQQLLQKFPFIVLKSPRSLFHLFLVSKWAFHILQQATGSWVIAKLYIKTTDFIPKHTCELLSQNTAKYIVGLEQKRRRIEIDKSIFRTTSYFFFTNKTNKNKLGVNNRRITCYCVNAAVTVDCGKASASHLLLHN